MDSQSFREQFLTGILTPTQALEAAFVIIEKDNPDINAFLHTDKEAALAAAAEATKLYAEKGRDTPPLLGVPVAIKNNILMRGRMATGASKMLENYVASYDATVVKKMSEAGAIIIGDTNMDEFAMGGSTENSAFGVTKNPLDRTRIPGGSSGGSAAAVAMGAVPLALGTDTGGSVRQPAAFCGLVGLKPTYGSVSRYGVIAMGSSLDQVGPITRTVADAELVHQIISGTDKYDATTILPDTYGEVTVQTVYKIGVPRAFLTGEGVATEVQETFASHLEALQKAGHEIVDIELPLFEQGLPAYYVTMLAEVSSNLARYDGIRYGLSVDGDNLLDIYQKTRAEGFGPEVKRRILLGTYMLSAGFFDAYYKSAEKVRSAMRRELQDIFQEVDLIVTPTTPTPAFVFGSRPDPLSMYKQDIFTAPVNLTGVPALTIPAGKTTVLDTGKELPIGVQYIAPWVGEKRLFAIGKQLYDANL